MIRNHYKGISIERPVQIHWGKYIKNVAIREQEKIDHFLYSMPLLQKNWNFNKQFPSTYVGQPAFERAYRFLLERNPDASRLLGSDSVFMHRTHFWMETEPFINAERKRFRAKFDIPDTTTVFMIAPGNAEREVNWAVPRLQSTFQKLMGQIEAKGLNSDDFVIVMPTSPSCRSAIQSASNSGTWKAKVIYTESEEDKYSAMAGSDIGICYNGDIVTECLVNQLPTIVLQDYNKTEFYFMLSWNRMCNDMNIIADGPLFPEIVEAQLNPEKMV
jgi:hypothetical protein